MATAAALLLIESQEIQYRSHTPTAHKNYEVVWEAGMGAISNAKNS